METWLSLTSLTVAWLAQHWVEALWDTAFMQNGAERYFFWVSARRHHDFCRASVALLRNRQCFSSWDPRYDSSRTAEQRGYSRYQKGVVVSHSIHRYTGILSSAVQWQHPSCRSKRRSSPAIYWSCGEARHTQAPLDLVLADLSNPPISPCAWGQADARKCRQGTEPHLRDRRIRAR
jgi:hypothetical protein